jgi:hypothetical protein
MQGHSSCLIILPQLGGLANKFSYCECMMGVLALPLSSFLLKLLDE